jgi:hypothetical protein
VIAFAGTGNTPGTDGGPTLLVIPELAAEGSPASQP